MTPLTGWNTGGRAGTWPVTWPVTAPQQAPRAGTRRHTRPRESLPASHHVSPDPPRQRLLPVLPVEPGEQEFSVAVNEMERLFPSCLRVTPGNKTGRTVGLAVKSRLCLSHRLPPAPAEPSTRCPAPPAWSFPGLHPHSIPAAQASAAPRVTGKEGHTQGPGNVTEATARRGRAGASHSPTCLLRGLAAFRGSRERARERLQPSGLGLFRVHFIDACPNAEVPGDPRTGSTRPAPSGSPGH